MHPGKEGTVTVNPPSGSSFSNIRKVKVLILYEGLIKVAEGSR